MKLIISKYIDVLGGYFSVFLMILVLIGFSILWVLNDLILAFKSLILIIPIIFASIALLDISKHKVNFYKYNHLFSIDHMKMVKLYFVFYSLSVLCLIVTSTRPWYYFIIMTLLSVILLIQIFNNNIHVNIILFEIILTLVNYTYGVTLNYPFYFGNTDILPHVSLSQITFYSGHIVPESFNYSYFPLYHIYTSISTYILNLDIKTSLFITTGIVFAMSSIFVYLTSKEMLGNTPISLLISYLYSFSPIVLFSSTYVVTRTFAFIGFVMLLYLIYVNYNNPRMQFKFLSILTIVFMSLVHQVSLAQISILLFIYLICEYIAQNKKTLNTSFYLLFNTLFLAYWFYVAYDYMSGVISRRIKLEFFLEPIVNTPISNYENDTTFNFFSYITSNINTAMFLFFSLIAIGYILKNRKDAYTLIALFSLSTLIFYVPSPLHILWQTLSLLQFDRFVLLLSPFMSIIMGIGIIIFCNYIFSKKTKKYTTIILIITIIFFTTPSLIYSASDNNYFQQTDQNRKYFNFEELNGFEHAILHSSKNNTIYTDHYSSRYLRSNSLTSTTIADIDDLSQNSSYFLIRYGEFVDVGLPFQIESLLKDSGTFLYIPSEKNIYELEKASSEINYIYNSHSIKLYKSIN